MVRKGDAYPNVCIATILQLYVTRLTPEERFLVLIYADQIFTAYMTNLAVLGRIYT